MRQQCCHAEKQIQDTISMKIYVNAANEDWICDRFMREWYGYNQEISTLDPREADLIWLLAGWTWQHMPLALLRSKPVVLTVHHIVPEKWHDAAQHEFNTRDRIVDLYHVPCAKTKEQLLGLGVTENRIFCQPFWANQNIWHPLTNVTELREKFGLSRIGIVIGSFQRDTEGSDLRSPKLEKGPDRLCDEIIDFHDRIDGSAPLEVLLGGWRRQYVMKRLDDAGIRYIYLERAPIDVVNEMYNCTDLYIVSSRHEGGPQAIAECALTRTPIVSTDVGLARDILSEKSILNDETRAYGAVPDVDGAWKNIQQYTIPYGFEPFHKMFKNIVTHIR
jgi:glycosyltransferase involved in cell wall biosynthesis